MAQRRRRVYVDVRRVRRRVQLWRVLRIDVRRVRCRQRGDIGSLLSDSVLLLPAGPGERAGDGSVRPEAAARRCRGRDARRPVTHRRRRPAVARVRDIRTRRRDRGRLWLRPHGCPGGRVVRAASRSPASAWGRWWAPPLLPQRSRTTAGARHMSISLSRVPSSCSAAPPWPPDRLARPIRRSHCRSVASSGRQRSACFRCRPCWPRSPCSCPSYSSRRSRRTQACHQ